MKIFISWSKDKSKELAAILESWLKYMFNRHITIWYSPKDIDKGTVPFEEIEKALLASDHGIICLTKNNLKSPWIMFEAGAIFKRSEKNSRRANIWSILFEGDSKDLIGTPLGNFQFTPFTREDMYNLAKSINNKTTPRVYTDDDLLKERFDLYWLKLETAVNGTLGYDCSEGNKVNKQMLMDELHNNGFPEPLVSDVTFYEAGFEDHPLYKVLLRCAQKRLWFFGRKNTKLFGQGTQQKDFWDILTKKIEAGFDFRCLFLNPKAPKEVVSVAQEKEDFLRFLIGGIINAYNILNSLGLTVSSLCKAYSTVRYNEIIIVDDVVLFSRIGFNSKGLPDHITDSSFNLVSITDEIGIHHKRHFEDVWKKAKAIDNSFISLIKKLDLNQ